MTNFSNSLKSLVNQQMIAKAARTVDEKESNISKAVSMIIPSLLAVLMKRRGSSPQIENILREAGNLDLMSEIGNLCEEKPSAEQRRIGDEFLQLLLGDKAADFTNPIADEAGISRVATNRLVSMISPIVAGYLGNKLVMDNWSNAQLFEEIEKEKSHFQTAIPSNLIKAFGLGTVLNAAPRKVESVRTEKIEKSGNKSWIIWLILLALLLLLFFGWRSCKNMGTDFRSESVVMTDTIKQMATRALADITPSHNRETIDLTLPNGSMIKVYKGGVEEKMIKYMDSDDYKKATDEDLKEKWFEFDDISFAFGSATDLNPDSQKQLDNIAALLKSNKDIKIRIAGFADKKGTEEANMQISKERAKTIESILDSKGVGDQIVKTEGFGDEYATHSASESDAARAEDRDIALRFVK